MAGNLGFLLTPTRFLEIGGQAHLTTTPNLSGSGSAVTYPYADAAHQIRTEHFNLDSMRPGLAHNFRLGARFVFPRVGGIALNVEEQGAGPAFIFIPGLVGLLDAWSFQVAHFSKRFRCVAFDHRGTGDSDKPKDSYSTALIAQDTIALMDKLGLVAQS